MRSQVEWPAAGEELLGEKGLPFSCFRPQYIYGPKQGKSYLAPLFDRACRGRPVLVPGDGSQLVSLTHAADNAAMIAAAIGNSKAVGQIFNCGTTNFITYKDLAKLCGVAILGGAPGSKVMFRGTFPAGGRRGEIGRASCRERV